MNKNTFFYFLILFILFWSCKQPNEEKESIVLAKPNIVLINVDDLGWKDLGYMGSDYYETPNIDALAKEGMTFRNAYAGASNCAPSRASMLSGLNTPRHGVYTVSPSARGNTKFRKIIPIENTDHLQESVYTLPKMLKSAGYVTGSFGKWHVGEDPRNQGIDVNVGGSGRGNPGRDGYFSPYNLEHIKSGPKGEYLTDRLTEEAISFVEKYQNTTFFLYLPFCTVHSPIQGKAKLIEKFQNKKGSNGQNNPDYAAMIASMDENVGKLLSKIKEFGLNDNTMVIFTSDNGGVRATSAQDPLRAGKGSYYEGGIKIPLIIKWSGKIKSNTSNDSRVSHLDFYPTLQQIVKPQKNKKMLDGMDLGPLLKKGKKTIQDLFFHFPIYLGAYDAKIDDGRDPLFRTRPGSVIISGDWKLHHCYEDDEWELYNLRNDPGEGDNLYKKEPEQASILKEKLNNWLNKTKAPIPSEKNLNFDASFEKQQRELIGKSNDIKK